MAGILELMGHVQDQGDKGRARGLSQLIGKAYNAPPDQRQAVLGQVANVDGGMAMDAQKAFGQQDDAIHDQIIKRAAMVSSLYKANPQMAQAAYQGLPELAQRGGFGQVPPQLDDKVAAALGDMVRAAQQAGNGQAPAQQQYAQWLLSQVPEADRAQALGVLAGTKARPATGGFQQVKFTDAQGRDRVGVMNGRTGQIDLPDGTSFDPNTGQVAPTQQGGAMDYAPAPEVTQDIDMQTLPGQDVPQQDEVAMLAAAQSPNGVYRPQPNGGAMPMQAQQGGGDMFTSRPKEQQAFLDEQAKQQAQIGTLPQRNVLEAQGAGMKEGATQAVQIQATGPKKEAELAAETRQKALANLPVVMQNSQQTIAVIDKALSHPGLSMATGLSSKIDPRNLIPGTAGYDFSVVMDQLKGKAFLEAFNTLKGGGQITEVEGKKATDAIARLNTAQSEGEFKAALRELRGIAEMAQRRAMAQAQGRSPAQAPQGGGNVIRYDAQGNRIQ